MLAPLGPLHMQSCSYDCSITTPHIGLPRVENSGEADAFSVMRGIDQAA
jgi:hypothetical protein